MPDEPIPSDPTTALHTPEAVAVRAEVARITADPNILDRDKRTTIDALYAKQYGSAEVKIGGGIVVEGRPGSPPSAQAAPEWAQEKRRELGAAWDNERQKVVEVGRKLSGGNAEAEEALIEKLLAAGLSEGEIFDMARRLA